MAIKKSDLYSSLWASCDELRGGMDASQYKDYVLVLLFVKYVSDKYAGQPYAPITIPQGASFADMVALKGTKDIGDDINKKILAPLAQANHLSDMPDFNDPNKLGSGKEMVERLTNLIAIFENPALDFSKNRADGDDLLGDAYEYLMRHFATESGKSKGQFYTPAEVSRVIAHILGIRNADTSNATTVYDPTCGSGSLLLKIGDEARRGGKDVKVTLYGQEKDSSTAGLARMNMILHDYATAEIRQGNTLANPLFTEGEVLKSFDYVVANPPFSDKRWSTGMHPDEGGKSSPDGQTTAKNYGRFTGYGIPPAKQGDYGYLLHILRSLKSTGKGACILPHGVLFRGNAEGVIRRHLIQRGVIKGIIGLPANLFYGTGIPACIIVLDKEHAQARKGIFMIDASNGFRKDGPKNRLREQDLHRIVDIADDLPHAGYTEARAAQIKRDVERYLKLRDIIRAASGETIDLKAYEADMRHLIDTYIEAKEPRTISGFGEIGLLDLIVKSGIADAINSLPEGIKGNKGAIAETIANNVRSKIIKEHLNDPAFYDKMSALLKEILADLKAARISYEEFLKRVAEKVIRPLQAGKSDDTPARLNTPGKRALYSNLKKPHPAVDPAGVVAEGVSTYQVDGDPALELALRLDEAVKKSRPNAWRGFRAKEQVIKGALFNVLQDHAEVERLFLIIRAQPEY